MLKNELMKERRELRRLGGVRDPIGANDLPAGEPKTRFRDICVDQIQKFADRFLGVVAEEDDNILDEIVSTSVDERDILVGALCGSGIDLRQPDEKPDPVFELAWWLAHLRQKGESQLRGDFADLFEEVKRDTREELTDLLYASLSDNVWTGLLEAADEIGRTDQTMAVSYTWGSVEQPWAVLRQGNEIKITGPLLYFPVTEAGKWARLSELIAENGDFVVPE